jgi:hypothetical protein
VTVVTEVLTSEEEAEETEVVPPVLNVTLWRFAIAMATSSSSAETDEAAKSARTSVMASERMLRGGGWDSQFRQASIKMVGICV